MYNPATGRFNRLDDFAGAPNDPQTYHKYAYVHGDPVNGIDPSGEFMVGALVGLAVGTHIRGMSNAASVGAGLAAASAVELLGATAALVALTPAAQRQRSLSNLEIGTLLYVYEVIRPDLDQQQVRDELSQTKLIDPSDWNILDGFYWKALLGGYNTHFNDASAITLGNTIYFEDYSSIERPFSKRSSFSLIAHETSHVLTQEIESSIFFTYALEYFGNSAYQFATWGDPYEGIADEILGFTVQHTVFMMGELHGDGVYHQMAFGTLDDSKRDQMKQIFDDKLEQKYDLHWPAWTAP